MEDKVFIPYAELKRLITQENNLKNQIASLEEEIQELEYEVNRLDIKLFQIENGLVDEEEEELIDD